MKKMIAILFTLCVFLGSCGKADYANTIPCDDITSSLREELLGAELYQEFNDNDVKFIFDSSDLYDSSSVIFSVSSDDIGEVGVFHAKDSESAQKLLDEAIDYVENMKDEKQEFLKNYMHYK